jgi:predicted oxidoreductase
VLKPFVERVRAAARRGLVELRFRHRVDALSISDGAVDGVSGTVLAPDGCLRGQASNRTETGTFSLRAQAVVVTSGGIGGNHELVRRNWPARLGTPPKHMVSGVPAHVDGRMIEITQAAGGTVIHPDRMWHYVEGIRNWDPIWPMHGIRIIPGPSSLWLDATGARLPVPLFPGYDTLGALDHIMQTGHEHTWFVLNQRIIEKELALSGSEQNPDITSDSWLAMLRARVGSGAPAPVEAFKRRGPDFVVERDLDALIAGMSRLDDRGALDAARVRDEVLARDREVANPFAKDLQLAAIREARRYVPDRITRVVAPHRLTDPDAGPLIAVKLHILTRKTLGGIQTDLDGRVLSGSGEPLPGLYAAGEVAGFGGGGMHGYRALEGTFLGGCLFSGRTAGRALGAALA